MAITAVASKSCGLGVRTVLSLLFITLSVFIQTATVYFEWLFVPSSLTPQQTRTDAVKLIDHSSVVQYVFSNGTVNTSPRRLMKSSFNHSVIACPPNGSVGLEMHGGSQVLHKIRRGLLKSQELSRSTAAAAAAGKNSDNNNTLPRVLCMVYTYEPNHATNLQAILDTWAPQCDGFFAASNVTDHSMGAIDFSHIQQGPEAYANMWQKVRAMWKYVHEHYRNDYDYFHICGDDVYLVPDNLRAYLGGPQVVGYLNGDLDAFSQVVRRSRIIAQTMRPRPLLLGQPMARARRRVTTFPAGGPGYTLNGAALDIFIQKGYDSFHPNKTDFREDAFVGGFFELQGIWVSDTRDDTNASRYGGEADAVFHFDGRRSPIFPSEQLREWGVAYNKGIGSASEQTVSFHLKDRKEVGVTNLMYRYHALLHGLCGV